MAWSILANISWDALGQVTCWEVANCEGWYWCCKDWGGGCVRWEEKYEFPWS